MTQKTLGLGIIGAGRFAAFLADAVADLPDISVRAVADRDAEAAALLAKEHLATAYDDPAALLADDRVDVVVVATPPSSHAELATAVLAAGKHLFCEKPLATSYDGLSRLAALAGDRVVVVDHVLRYNPLLAAVVRMQDELLGAPQRFLFENDASDEDLGQDHWFWQREHSGGIFVEHGVHFFDAAAMLLGRPATSVTATAANRPSGEVDLVSATVQHGDAVLATHTHSFTHAHRAERQLMRLDHGTAETRIEGWIPIDATVDLWTDDHGVDVSESWPGRLRELMAVDGYRLGSEADLRVSVRRDEGSTIARGRGHDLAVPHHVRIDLTLGGPAAKPEVYAESVRAAMTDLVRAVLTGARPVSGLPEAAAAVTVALAATASADLRQHVDLSGDPS